MGICKQLLNTFFWYRLSAGFQGRPFLINKDYSGEIFAQAQFSRESYKPSVAALRENVIKRTSGSNLSFTFIDFRVPVDTK